MQNPGWKTGKESDKRLGMAEKENIEG